MKHKKACQFTLAAVALLFLASVARADSIGISLTQPGMTGLPGSTITFDATLTNLSSTNTIFLNGDSSSTSSLFLTVDDTPFLINFPLSLNPGQSSGPFALFNVLIDPAALPGTYGFNSFSILGGLDGSSFDTLGTASFSVTVASPPPVPEPSSIYLLLSGILVLFLISWWKAS